MRIRLTPLFLALLLAPALVHAQIMTDPTADAGTYTAPEPGQNYEAGENIITPGEGEEEIVEPAPQKLPPPEKAPASPPPAAQPAPAATPPEELNVIRLQGLNKVTARISTFEAPLGTVLRFGNLEIIAKRCWKSPPEEQPENASFIEIRELKPGEGPQTIFNGWMFSSSPALSSLEHPVYDVTVLACEHADLKDE